MTSACDKFEVEIGMRQHGALDAEEEAALDAHLAGCAGCRRFAQGDFAHAIEEEIARERERVDWSALEKNIRSLQRAYRLKLWLAPLFLLQVPIAFIAATGHLPADPILRIFGPLMTVAIYLAWVWLVNRPFREVLSVVRDQSDLLAGYLRELARRRRRARSFALGNGALALACLAVTFFESELRPAAYALGCALLFGAWALFDLVYTLPRLARELDEAGQ